MAGLDGKSTTRRPSANRFPTEILREIFELAIPTSYPSPVENNSLSTFIATTAPYNILRVSHSWKDLVLSIPSLWSSFFYSFSYPSDATLKVLICLIERHSERSHGLPLTSFVRLAGHYNHSLSRAIANLLSTHQSRWRSVGIWFETEGHEEGVRSSSRSVPAGMPVPKNAAIHRRSCIAQGSPHLLLYAIRYHLPHQYWSLASQVSAISDLPRPACTKRAPRNNALARPLPQPPRIEHQLWWLLRRLRNATSVIRDRDPTNALDTAPSYQSARIEWDICANSIHVGPHDV